MRYHLAELVEMSPPWLLIGAPCLRFSPPVFLEFDECQIIVRCHRLAIKGSHLPRVADENLLLQGDDNGQ